MCREIAVGVACEYDSLAFCSGVQFRGANAPLRIEELGLGLGIELGPSDIPVRWFQQPELRCFP